MDKPLTWLLRLVAVLLMASAVGLWLLDGPRWLSLILAAAGGVCAWVGWVPPSPDEARGNVSSAIFVNPHTLAPDFDGYRPRESDLPQEQPAGEIYERESTAALFEEENLETVEHAPDRLPKKDPSIKK